MFFSQWKRRIVAILFCGFFLYIHCCNIPNWKRELQEVYWCISFHFEKKNLGDLCNSLKKFNLAMTYVHDQNTDRILDSSGLKDTFFKIYGDFLKLQNRNYVEDTQFNIAQMKTGHLTIVTPWRDLSKQAQQYLTFERAMKKRGVPVLFVLAPHKVSPFNPQLPRGISDASNQISDDFLKILQKNEAPYVDTRNIFKNSPQKHGELFYRGDTHWKAQYAFYAFRETAQFMEKHFHIPVKSEILNPENYCTQLSNQILDGDLSVRWDSIFTSEERIEWFVPRFPTQLEYQDNTMETPVTGAFRPEFFYGLRHRNIKNPSNPSGKILVLGDSFSPPWIGYMSLAYHEIRSISSNHFINSSNCDVKYPNLKAEIETFQPQFIVILLTGRGFVNRYFQFLEEACQ